MKFLKYVLVVILFQAISLNTAAAAGLFVDETSPYFQPIQECIGDKPSQSSNCHYEEFLMKLDKEDVELALQFCESEFNWPPSRGWARCAVLADDISYCEKTDKRADCMSIFYSPVHRPEFTADDLITMGNECKAENILDKCYPLIRDACKDLDLDSCESVITQNYSKEIYGFYLEWKNQSPEENRMIYYLPDFFECPRNVKHTPDDDRKANDQCILETVENYLANKNAPLSIAEVENLAYACYQISDTYLAKTSNSITVPEWQKCTTLIATHQKNLNICTRNKQSNDTCITNALAAQPKSERAVTYSKLADDIESDRSRVMETASATFLSVYSKEAKSINTSYTIIFLVLFGLILFVRIKSGRIILEYFAAFFLLMAFFHGVALIQGLPIFVYTAYYSFISQYVSDYITNPWLYILISDLTHLFILLPLILALALKSSLNRIIAMIVMTILIMFGINFYMVFQIYS